ncbi:MAG: hypothetical protein KDC48_23355, partial [Planctomycetes bacterium]|nr:hypothetical protein [Planctomycetota bacterium]
MQSQHPTRPARRTTSTATWSSVAVLALLSACASQRIEPHPWFRTATTPLGEALEAAASAPPEAHSTDKTSTTPLSSSHPAGSAQVTGQLYYGVPILQKSFFWDGNGETDVAGLGVHYLCYLWDGIALGVGSNASNWFIGGRDAQSLELEGKIRIHPLEQFPAFIEGTGGYVYANEQVPPGGTYWNFTFGFGTGVELPVTDATWLQCGV